MKNIKLITLLKSYTEDEWVSYEKFIKANDVISPRKYLPLVIQLRKNISLPFQKIDIEQIFTKAFGKSGFKLQTINNRQTELLKISEKFLIDLALKKSPLAEENFLTHELGERGLAKNLEEVFRRADRKIEKFGYEPEMLAMAHATALNKASFKQSMGITREFFNDFFEHSLLYLADAMNFLYRNGYEFVLQKSYNIDFEFNPLLEFLNLSDADALMTKIEKMKKPYFIIPVIRYYLFKSASMDNNEEYAMKAEKLFFAHQNKFPDYMRVEFYRMLMSHYLIKINGGEYKYFSNLFYLCDSKLKSNLLDDFKVATYPANMFREYIIAGLETRKYSWVENFLNNYTKYLPENVREDEYSLGMIRLYISKENFRKALEIIEKSASVNIVHRIDTSRYKLICLYELDMTDECETEYDKLKRFIKNGKKIPVMNKDANTGFLEKYFFLLKYKLTGKSKDIGFRFKDMKAGKQNVIGKGWLLKKAEEITG